MIAGFICGLVFYALTAFPLGYFTGWDTDLWAGVCMLYGVVCGGVGAAAGAAFTGVPRDPRSAETRAQEDAEMVSLLNDIWAKQGTER